LCLKKISILGCKLKQDKISKKLTMKKYILVLLWIMISSISEAQNAQKDSLFQIVKSGPTDTNAINALCKLGDIIADENLDSAYFYYDKSHQLALKQNYLKGISNTYSAFAYYEGYSRNNVEKGVAYAQAYLNWALKNKYDVYVGKALFSNAVIYHAQNKYDSARYYYDKAIPYIQQHQPKEIGVIYSNLANIYDNLQYPQKAFEYFDKAFDYYQKDKDTLGLISIYINRGKTYVWTKDTVAEEKSYRMALDLATKINNKNRMMTCYNNLSQVYQAWKIFDSSTVFIQKALELTKTVGTKEDEIRLRRTLAKNYFDQKNYAKAYTIINDFVKDTLGANLSLNLQSNILSIQYDVLIGLKKYKEATEVIEKYLELNAIITTNEKDTEMLELDEKLKKSEQTKQLLEKENQLVKQRSTITYLLTGLGVVTVLGLCFFYFQKLKIEAKKRELLNLQREQELKATKAKLEGQLNERIRIAKEIHDDLGSSMTSISLLTEVLKKKIDTNIYPEINRISYSSSEMVDKMNEIIWTLNIGNDNVQSLVAYIRKFATNFLDDAQLMLSFEAENLPLEKEIDGSVRRNIYLCVKEAINNIVKHAKAHKIEVKIEINMVEQHPDTIGTEGLMINIKDDGKGIDTQHISILGNGLKNMQKRMNDIGGQFLIHSNNGTEITLSYPL
jgi:signal transduction histidine kinase